METKDRVAINKTEFVSRYAQINGISKRQAAAEVDNFLTAVYKTVASGEGVKLPGFGSFLLKYRKPMVTQCNFGGNAGKPMVVPERYSLIFEPCEALKGDVKKITVD